MLYPHPCHEGGDYAAGLVMAGGVNPSFISRMPVLLRTRPVKAASLRVARTDRQLTEGRIWCNGICGFEPCSLIWLAVPDAILDKIAHDLAEQTSLEGKMIVVCGSSRESTWPGPLAPAAPASPPSTPLSYRTKELSWLKATPK